MNDTTTGIHSTGIAAVALLRSKFEGSEPSASQWEGADELYFGSC